MLCTAAIIFALAAQAYGEILTPPYFNLAEGRKAYATATCGEDTEGPELFCKLVGPTNAEGDASYNNVDGQHCDVCDPSTPDKRHPPEFAVNGRETWWQSPPLSRGMRYNEVNFTIDLGQEFHVAYVYVRMGNSPRPGLWILEKSMNYGKTFVPWQFFAESSSDCLEFFGEESLQPITRDDSVICTSEFSRIVPLEGGEIPISLLNNRPSANHYFNSTVLQEWTRATNVRLRLMRTKNLLGHLMSVTRQDPTVTRRYFYSIKDISIGGRCMCNGHADSCDNRDATDPGILVCLCRHNTCGPKCDTCCPGFEQKAWRQSKSSAPFECEPCNCFSHSDKCEYDAEVDKRGESLDIHGRFAGGGVCKECQHNTEGINCNRCVKRFYRPAHKQWNETDVCQPCDCDKFFSTGNCAEGSGRCECRPEYEEPNCDRCSFGNYGYPNCKACDCNINGTIHGQCELDLGTCTCKTNFGGDDCRRCAEDYFNYPECEPCECNPLGAMSSACEMASGNCTCKNNYGGKRCEQCQDGYFNYPSCSLCTCDTKGTKAAICNKNTGECICKEGYTGANCDQCDVNFYGYPDCKPCNCSTVGSSGTTCGATGKCTCLTGFAGRTCELCSPGYYKYPECLACDCDAHGANGVSCNNDGICQCHHNFDGEKCDHCMDGFYNFPACEECNCNPAGVIAAFAGCGSVPKGELCQCKERVEGRICDKCKPLYWNLNAHHPQGCEECHCHVPGVIGGIAVCDSEQGTCPCKPNVVARRCTECDDGTYDLREDNLFGCTDCGCDVGGAMNNGICHKTSGQCQCQPRITGRTCNEPIGMHYFPTLFQYQYEAEDGRTQDADVRFLYSETDFPGYSWKGYAVFNHLQKEIIHDVTIFKPSLYRVVLRYANKGMLPISGVVRVVPEGPSDYEQSYPVVFNNTSVPQFLTINTANTPVGFVMNPGKWTVHIQADKNVLLDYFVLLPEEFYMANILKQKVLEPCTIDSKTLCRLFKYPETPDFDTSLGSGGYIDLGDNSYANPSKYYENDNHMKQLNISNARIPMVTSDHEIDYNITLKKPDKYVIVINYVTPLDDNRTHLVNVAMLDGNDVDDGNNANRVVLYTCPYTTMCRQVVTDDEGIVKVFAADQNTLHLRFQGPTANVGMHSVVAIPLDEWSLDYIQPRPICIRKDGVCMNATYTNPSESKKIRFDKNAVLNEDHPQPVVRRLNGVNYVYLNQSNNMIDVRSKVSNPGMYTFVVHYHQPDHPAYDMDVLIQNGFIYEANVELPHCPKLNGCRSVITHKDGSNKFSLTENFMVTLTNPDDKHVFLDYILVVPSDLYSRGITVEDDFDRAGEFIVDCGANHFFIGTNETGFCRDSVFSITAGYNAGALRCQCDYAGSLSFDCDKFGGQCKCKDNVIGRDCSICKMGYYGFPDCKPCNCPQSSICEPNSGQCICPPRIIGEQCDRCEPYTYGFDEFNGCVDCKCNALGVQDTLQCDLHNGTCPCKANVGGRKCDACMAGHYGFPYCDTCECNLDGTTKEICDQQSAECYCKKLVTGQACDICMEGTYNLQAGNEQGCTECFCFGKTNRCYASNFLHRSVLFNMDDWGVAVIDEDLESLNVTTLNITNMRTPQSTAIDVPTAERNKTLYFSAPSAYLGKRLASYGGILNYTIFYTIGDSGKATLQPDVIIVGANNYLKYHGFEQPPADETFQTGVEIVEGSFVLPSGAPAKREHLMVVLKDVVAVYIRATYWSHTLHSQLGAVTLDDARKMVSGREHHDIAHSVEICDCPPNYSGQSCEECAPGYYRISTGPHGGYCVACSCNGHAASCDINTGVCLDCQHNTVGDHCDQCAVGYHGNAKQGTPMDCLICACPLPIAGNNFASGCDVSADGERIHCTCNDGYSGARCQHCGAGFYGRPEVAGDYCKPCQCSGNINTNDLSSCDTVSGDCLKCMNNTFGAACALCAPGYFGDAIMAKDCQSCVCDALGTAECNSYTGECQCKANVVGDKCDRCEVDHYGFASGGGCAACNCAEASNGSQCDDATGQCRCKPGVTGRTCNRCKAGYWNLTEDGCISCGCKDEFSIGVGCNAQTGQCECLPGVTGDKCDRCPYRWSFVKEYGCQGCDSCTDDLLDFTDYLATLIDPIQLEFNSVGSDYFTTRRLAHINDTISKLKPKVESLTPDKVNFKPTLTELDTMDNEANNMNRKANYSLENSKNLVKSSNDLRTKAMALVDKVQESSDDALNTIDDIDNMSKNLLKNESPRMETARKVADDLLSEMKRYNLSDREMEGYEALEHVDDLTDLLMDSKQPIDDFGNQLRNVKAELQDLNFRLDDLANQTQFSLAKSQEAKNLYDSNGKDRLMKKLNNINTQTKEKQNNINESTDLNKNATKLLVLAHKNYEDMSEQSENFAATINDGEERLTSYEEEIEKFEDKMPEIQRHSTELLHHAGELDKILNDTLKASENAVKAATAYDVIKSAIEEAAISANESVLQATETKDTLSNVAKETMKSEYTSNELLDAADQEMNNIKSMEPHVTNATQKLQPVQYQHQHNKDVIDNIDNTLRNYVAKDLNTILQAAKKHADSAEANARNALNATERGFQQIEYKLLDSKDLSQKAFAANQAIVQVQKELESVNVQLPEIVASVQAVPERRDQEAVRASLAGKINKLNEQIALARDLANRIEVGMKFNPRTTLELRNPQNIADLSTSTQVSGYFRTPVSDSMVLFLGNGNGTMFGRTKSDDYILLQIVNGYPTLTMDLGNGAEQIVNKKYVADDQWYQFIIDRIGLNAKLTIREQAADGSEKETVTEQQLEGPLSIFNLDRNHSKLFVGSHPVDFEPPVNVHTNSFVGAVEGLVVGDTPVSLWNFNRGYENNEGASQRDKLLKPKASGYRFNGNGYAILNARALTFNAYSDVKLDFKTFASEGLIFLYGDERSFISLELRNGKILYKYKLGGETMIWHTPGTYNDGEWHTVNAIRDGASGRFVVDAQAMTEPATTISVRLLEPQETFFVGGYPQNHKIKDVTTIDFDGCIDNLQIIGRPIDLTNNIKSYGVLPGCPAKFSGLVSFDTLRPGYVKHTNISSPNDLKVNLKFKTKEKSGLIFYATNEIQEPGISLSLANGHLQLISQKMELVTKNNNYNNNEWHVVSVTHNGDVLRLDIDDIDTIYADSPPALLLMYGEIYVGGLPKAYVIKKGMISNYAPFAGCIADATVNGNLINFANSTDRKAETLGKCTLDKLVGSDSDIHVVPILPPLEEFDNTATEEPEEHTANINKDDTPKRGDGGKDDGENTTDSEDLIDIETTTWPTPRPHPTQTSTTPPVCALPREPAIDQELMRSGSFSYGSEKGSRLEYTSSRGRVRKSFQFDVEFKTLSPNGIIFYVADVTHKQYATLYLQDGYVYFTFSSGAKSVTIRSDLLYADNVWHKAIFKRDFSFGMLDIDGDTKTAQSDHNITKLEVVQPYYLGGVHEKVYNHEAFPLKSIDQFVGCIRNFQMNDKPMENPTTHAVHTCSENMEEGIFFSSAGGYMRLRDKFKVGYELEVKMDLKPRDINGLIMAVHGRRDYFVLELDNGALKLTVDNGKGPITTKFQPSTPHQFCDGQWHSIQAVKSKSVVTLAVNGVYSDPGIGDHKSASTDTIGYLFLGGHRMIHKAKGITVRTPYVGCIRNVWVNGAKIVPEPKMVDGSVQIGSCPTN